MEEEQEGGERLRRARKTRKEEEYIGRWKKSSEVKKE